MVTRFVNVSITLATAVAPTASFTEMFLVDEAANVPLDRRYLDTTRASYTDDLVASTNALAFATAFWSQKRTATTLRIGRWASAATEPYYVTGATSSTVAWATWAAISDASFTVQDNTATPLEDDFTSVDFTGITNQAGFLTVLNTELAGATPNIAGLTTAAFEFDNFGRLRLVHSATGAAAKTLTIVSEGTGTDITGSAYFDIANGFIIAGIDAEEPTAAITAISNINDSYYKTCVRGESAVQQQALAAQFEALDKQLTLVSGVAADKDPVSTTDVPYILAALGYDNTSIIYTEHTITAVGGWVDAYADGTCLPALQGSTAWSNEKLTGAYSSGKNADSSQKELTATETGALEAKKCNYIATAGGSTIMTPGLNCSGEETRTIIGIHWLENVIETDIWSYNVNNPLPAFDDTTLTAYEMIVQRNLLEALERGLVVNTPLRPITITFPVADDFTAAQRASHTMTLTNVFEAYINSVVNEVAMTGTFRI